MYAAMYKKINDAEKEKKINMYDNPAFRLIPKIDPPLPLPQPLYYPTGAQGKPFQTPMYHPPYCTCTTCGISR